MEVKRISLPHSLSVFLSDRVGNLGMGSILLCAFVHILSLQYPLFVFHLLQLPLGVLFLLPV